MKRKMIIGVVLFVLLVLQTQTVFAQDYNLVEFLDKFSANDISGIEMLLREHGHQMDLQACLKAVAFNLVLLSDTERTSANVGGKTAIPMNRNRNSILRVIQLLVEAGLDINADLWDDVLAFKADDGKFYFYTAGRYSSILSVASSWDRLNVDIVRYLLSVGADVYEARFTIDDNWIAINRLLIEYGYNINNPTAEADRVNGVSIPARNYLLTEASERGQIATVRLLVESGAMVNRIDYKGAFDGTRLLDGKTAAQFAYEKREIDIYNYLRQNGAVWTAPSQVASTPPSSSNTYTPPTPSYTPPPSSSSSSSTPDRNIGREIAEAFRSPLQSGTYSLAGTQARIRLTSIARSGIFTYTNRQGRTGTGQYSIDGNRMTIQMEEYTFLYTVDSQTSFSGNGETWVRTGL
jgi:hypothetical protein